MRLHSLKRFYGLQWKGSFPTVAWRDWIAGLLFAALLIAVYVLVGYIGDNVKLADSNARAVHRADHAEIALAACLNGQSLSADDNSIIVCETYTTSSYRM